MFDIYEVNFEVKVRQNADQICKTIKTKIGIPGKLRST